jgi:hypothetical protein
MTTPAERGERAARDEGRRRCLQCGDTFTPMTDKEIFCSKDCYEAHEDRDWEYSDGGTFRVSRKTETFIRENGKPIVMQLCEELVEGQWEPFYAVKEIEWRRA